MLSLASKRTKLVASLVFALFVVFFISRVGDSKTSTSFFKPSPNPESEKPKPAAPKFHLFGIPGFGAEIEVATLNIKAREPADETKAVAHQQPLLTDIPIALPKFSTFHLDDPDFNSTAIDILPPGQPPATVTVDVAPSRNPPDASNIIFGAATTLQRLPDALLGFKHWAANTRTRFVFIVEPQNTTARPGEQTSDEMVTLYRQAGISLTLIESTEKYLDRYVALLGTLYDHLEPRTEWVSILDDDTFFFSMETLQNMLEKYDTSQEWYVGATSENKWNLNDGGIFAIGGAGIFFSRPLIKKIGPHSDDCVHLDNIFGDSRVADCVFKYTTTKLSMEHGLYQLDLHGDVTGFYEAVRPQPVAVHHWKTWHKHDMPTVASVSSVCGQECVLQSFRFKDGWQMTNGFSIVKYSYNETELASQITESMEHTWKKTIWDIPTSWKYSLEPLKPKDGGKVQYVIEKSEKDPSMGTVTLYYVRRKDGYGQGLIRVIWHEA